jgi:hypothetical protein
MKKFVLWSVTLVLPLAVAGCAGGSPEGALREQINLLNEMAATLENVNDASANAAVARLDKHGEKFKDVLARLENSKATTAEGKRLEERYKPELDKAAARMKTAAEEARKKAPNNAAALSAAMSRALPGN